MDERVGSIEIVSDDVIEWIVPCPEKNGDSFWSPEFLVDAYKASLGIYGDGDFYLYVHDADKLLELYQVTIALVVEERSQVIVSGKVVYFEDQSLVKTFKTSKTDLAEFTTSDGRLRVRCSFQMDPKYRKLPPIQRPLQALTANLFMSKDFSDGTLVPWF